MSAFLALLKRDLRLAVRQGGALGTALGFYMLVVTLLPLGLGADLNLLVAHRAGRAVDRAAAGGAACRSAASSPPTTRTARSTSWRPARCRWSSSSPPRRSAHWISTGIPLALMAPVLGLLLNLDIGAYPLLVATMLVGTPAVSFIGAVGAALTLRAYRGGLLIALLVLPLYVPTLDFRHGGDQRPARAPREPAARSLSLPRFHLRPSYFARWLRQRRCVCRCSKNRGSERSIALGGSPRLDHLQCRP